MQICKRLTYLCLSHRWTHSLKYLKYNLHYIICNTTNWEWPTTNYKLYTGYCTLGL